MKTNFWRTILAALCVAGLAVRTASAALQFDYVSVGNAGNAADSSTGYGAVGYDYQIGKYEVTLTQYAGFLNAVAASDSNGLYNTNMGSNLNIAGITRSGVSGGYTYAVVGDGQHPVTYVSFLDAMRFANWVNHGQGSGGTETGTYTLSLGGLATRNTGATVFVASENEWYKAAYYDPVSAGADANGTADYWKFATRSDDAPGNIVGSLSNQANYHMGNYPGGTYSVTQSASYSALQNYLTPGGAFSASGSYYGTFDQNGNVVEWNEAVIGSSRGQRGGGWSDYLPLVMESAGRISNLPTDEREDLGFRLAAVPVPEPTGTLTGLLCLGVAALRRRRRAMQ